MDLDTAREQARQWLDRQRQQQRRYVKDARQWRSDVWTRIRQSWLVQATRSLLVGVVTFGLIRWLIVGGVLLLVIGAVAVLLGSSLILSSAIVANEPRSIAAAGALLIGEGALLVYVMSLFIDEFAS